METKILPACILGLSLSASLSHGYTHWGCLRWASDQKVYTNNSTPTQYHPEVIAAIGAWNKVGVNRRMTHNGITGRDAANGCDAWYCDDDDGYNVVDWWTKYVGSSLAITMVIDVQNTDQCYLAEMDIVMNSSQPFAVNPTNTQISYRSVLTHEIGHFMGMNHSSEDDGLASGDPLRWATMWWRGDWGAAGVRYNTLSVDDINGLRAKYTISDHQVVSVPAGVTLTATKLGNQGVSFYLNPNRQTTDPEAWTTSSAIQFSHLAYIDGFTNVTWRELDRRHAMVVNLQITDVNGGVRDLNYARNASNWWHNQGWVCMYGCRAPNNPSHYNAEEYIRRNLWNDYFDEYPGAPAPAMVSRVQVRHFVNLSWSGDNGGYVKDFYIASDSY